MDRRSFLLLGAGAASAIGVGALPAAAEGGPAFTMSAAVKSRCATCTYWGGVRKLSKDGETLSFESRGATGWCNNPDSLNYHTLTPPETGPMASWKKWEALEDS